MSNNDSWLQQLEWQEIIFAEELHRSELLELEASWPCRHLHAKVWRNWPVELFTMASVPFLAFADLSVRYEMGDYDDSLSLVEQEKNHDFFLISLDVDRYGEDFLESDTGEWFSNRILELRQLSDCPIFVMIWSVKGREHVVSKWISSIDNIPGVYVTDVQAVISRLDEKARDERAIVIRATSLSDVACLEIAREWGLNWIPALFTKQIKAIGADLDNSLYTGILAEDGLSNLGVNEWQSKMNKSLTSLARRGILLGAISKNEPIDVDALFDAKIPNLIDRSSLAGLFIGWGAKSLSVKEMTARFNIGTDSVLFLDDNVGELAEVITSQPDVRILLANQSAANALNYYPGLFRFKNSEVDQLRQTDIAANEQRRKLASDLDPNEYLRSLNVTLKYSTDIPSEISRAFELAQKTNQFNMSVHRSSEAEISTAVDSPDRRLVTFSLRDRLSDSGNVGMLLGNFSDGFIVEELCISCRALGRGLDSEMVLAAIDAAIGNEPVEQVIVRWSRGPRNAPALEWLSSYAKLPVEGTEGEIKLSWNGNEIQRMLSQAPLIVEAI